MHLLNHTFGKNNFTFVFDDDFILFGILDDGLSVNQEVFNQFTKNISDDDIYGYIMDKRDLPYEISKFLTEKELEKIEKHLDDFFEYYNNYKI